MGELLFAGVTHFPPLCEPDDRMAELLRFALADPSIPEKEKDPGRWPEEMRREWLDSEGSARKHRAALVDRFREVRQAIDDFNPDVVVVWGDDQYENFQEDIVPPFCVLCYEETITYPWRGHRSLAGANDSIGETAIPNAWQEGPEHAVEVLGAPDIGKYLVEHLLENDIDMSYSYRPLHHPGLAHAFLNTVMFLDYDRAGFPYRVLPIAINCYGRRVIANQGGPIHFGGESYGNQVLDPPAPSPRRCYKMGAITAEALAASPWKCAIVASSSWSHAFLTDSTWRLRPDTARDKYLYEALSQGNYQAFRDLELSELEVAGQQEVLNWCALAGALEASKATIHSLNFIESYIFNSDKCFLLATPGHSAQ